MLIRVYFIHIFVYMYIWRGLSVVCLVVKAIPEPLFAEQQHCSPAFCFANKKIIHMKNLLITRTLLTKGVKLFTLFLVLTASIKLAYAEVYSGTCGKDVTGSKTLRWSFDTSTGVLDITGYGSMDLYQTKDAPWEAYKSMITTVNLTDRLKRIGDNAFKNCINLTAITIPDSVHTIGSGAFYNTRISEINIPDQLKSIAKETFYKTNISTITIPDHVTYIGKDAFPSEMQYVSIGKGVNQMLWIINADTLVWNAISCEDNGDQYSNIPERTRIQSIIFGEDVERIPACLCYGASKLKTITIPNRVKTIGLQAFSNCTNIKSVIIPDSVKTIELCAFDNCSKLESLYIGKSVENIGAYAFKECLKLKEVHISSIEEWCHINFYEGTCLETPCGKQGTNPLIYAHYLYVDNELITDLVIPESVTEIKDYTFYGARFNSIKILGNITKIGNHSFAECWTGRINIPYSTNSIGEYAFYNGGSSIQIIIPDGITKISEWAFSGSVFTDIIIPNSVTNLDNCSFAFMHNLKTLIIPNNVQYIGASAAAHSWLQTLYLGRNVTEIEGFAFSDNIYLKTIYAQMDTPPTVSSSVFPLSRAPYIDCYVPRNSLELYQSAEVWKEFNLIAADSIYIAIGLPVNPLYGYVQGHGCYSHGDTATLIVQSNEGYEFLRWSDGNTENPRNVIISQDTTLVAEYVVSKYHLTLTCDEEKGTINGTSGEFDYGTTHTFSVVPNTGFYFVQWSDGNTDNPRTITLTQDTTITAIFAAQKFIVKFVDDNDTILSSLEYEYGAIPVLPEDPVKTNDAQYSYTFAGWSPQIVAVTSNATYKATYTSTLNKYTITFMNEDSILSADLWEYGTTPVYRGATPTKIEDEQYTYIFSSWAPEIVPVVADATYTATFTATEKTEAIDNILDKSIVPVKIVDNDNIYILMPNGKKYSIIGEAVK